MALLDVFELRVYGITYDTRWVNRFYFREETACNALVPAQLLCTTFKTLIFANWRAFLSGGTLFHYLTARRIFPGPAATGLEAWQQFGGIAFPPATPLDSCVVSWFSLSDPEFLRGRTYLSGMPKTEVGEGRLKSDLLNNVQGWANRMQEQFTSFTDETGAWNLVLRKGGTNTFRPVVANRINPNLGRMGTRRATPGIAQLVS